MAEKRQKGVIFVGASAEQIAFYSRLKRPEKVLGVFCKFGAELPLGLSRLGDISDVMEFLDEHLEVKRVYCAITNISVNQIEQVQLACKTRSVKFCLVLPVVNEIDADLVSMRVNGNVVLTPKNEPLYYVHNRVLKRMFDLFFVILYMFAVFPFVYLWKSKFYNRKDRNPAFCKSVCCGPNNRPFNRISFWGETHSLANVFNVLKGDMSLVGPACYEVDERCGLEGLPKRLVRRGVKSGMMGWAQLHGVDEEQRMEADIWYTEHWSLWLDLRILFMSLV